MLSLKKVYRDELLQLALILSLMRTNQDALYENDIYNSVNELDFDNGTSWRMISPSVLRSHYVNPKSLDSVLLNYERSLFADLNSLGRYNRDSYTNPNVTAYLLNIERSASGPVAEPEPLPAPPQNLTEAAVATSRDESSPVDSGIELSQEDMDLIEVLWKQDVDLGFSLETPAAKPEKTEDAKSSSSVNFEDDLEKLKTLKAINGENVKTEPEPDKKNDEDDIWSRLNYTIDTETGEYVVKGELLDDSLPGADAEGPTCDLSLEDLSLNLPEFLLDEALQFVDDLDDETSSQAQSNDTDLNMIQTPQFHHPHHRAAFQSRMPFVRTVSMEQRWQDLASLLSLPPPPPTSDPHHPHHHPHHHHHHHSGPFAPPPPPHPHHHHHLGYGPSPAAPGGGTYPAPPSSAAAAVAVVTAGSGGGPDTRGVLLHNATLAPPMGEINGTGVGYPTLGGTNLGNAVATSMNLTNSSEPMGEHTAGAHYKMEPSHDMYYQNSTSELNQSDGFLSSILNDEDLQLMDMAMNEGMYTMRMMESNNTVSNLTMNATTPSAAAVSSSRSELERIDTSSDSAVSSMGSERVPSLSDSEWCDGGSDSGHTTTGEPFDYQNKFRYSYASRHVNNVGSSDSARMPLVAQKKHQMYGKRYFQDQGASAVHQPPTPVKYEYRDTAAASYNSSSQLEGAVGPKIPEMKYSCSVEFGRQSHARTSIDHIQHNHTYHLPAENSGAMQRPVSRDKSKSRRSEEEHLTRDEKRARALNVPISVDDIINLPMDEFNERLSKYDLSEAQLSLIRDIRRRGKNKVAAQNCRKRKLDQILCLADEVKEMRDRKLQLMHDHEFALSECKRMKDKYQQLYRHVFQNLRDPDGNQYSPFQYSLQTSADGSILMVPRSNSTLNNHDCKEPQQNHKD